MERSLGQDTKRLQDKEQELEWATEELQHVSLQQFTQQTGTNVTVLLTAPTEAEAPHADIETEAPFQSGSLKWPGSSQQLPRNLCGDLIDYKPPGSSVRGILQVRILEWRGPPPGNLPNPGIQPTSLILPALVVLAPPGKPFRICSPEK